MYNISEAIERLSYITYNSIFDAPAYYWEEFLAQSHPHHNCCWPLSGFYSQSLVRQLLSFPGYHIVQILEQKMKSIISKN